MRSEDRTTLRRALGRGLRAGARGGPRPNRDVLQEAGWTSPDATSRAGPIAAGNTLPPGQPFALLISTWGGDQPKFLREAFVSTVDEQTRRPAQVVLVQDGPVGANGRAGLRLHALAVGSRSLGSQLGYSQGTVTGPWLLRRLLHRAPRLIPWPAIVQRDKERIVVDPSLTPDQV